VASAEIYANHLHLAPDRWTCQHLITQFLQAGCSSWHWMNTVKTRTCYTERWYKLADQKTQTRLTIGAFLDKLWPHMGSKRHSLTLYAGITCNEFTTLYLSSAVPDLHYKCGRPVSHECGSKAMAATYFHFPLSSDAFPCVSCKLAATLCGSRLGVQSAPLIMMS